jgi:hypothetical protein
MKAWPEPTVANYPALKHFWKCDEGDGLDIVCSVTGATYRSDGDMSWTANANALTYIQGAGANSANGLVAGALFTPVATSKHVYLAVLGPLLAAGEDTFGVAFGVSGATTRVVHLRSRVGAKTWIAGPTNTVVAATTTPLEIAHSLAVTTSYAGTTLSANVIQNGAVTAAVDDATATQPSTYGDAANFICMAGLANDLVVYGIAVFEFASLPPNVAHLTHECLGLWTSGSKVLPLGLLGVA